MRELWVDRVGMGLGCALFAALWLLLGPAGFGWIAPLPFVILFAYEMLVPKVPMHEHWRRVARVARKVAKAHQARAVVFGHTHTPRAPGRRASSTATPARGRRRSTTSSAPGRSPGPSAGLAQGRRRIGPLEGGLYAWRDGNFVPTVVKEDPRRSDSDAAMDHMAIA